MNHLSFIKKMLQSLYGIGLPAVPFEVIIVDNCSTDGTADYLRENYPQVRLIENRQVYGFARNNNIGAEAANGKYILILNPDIILKAGAIDQLYQYAVQHPEAGIVAPQLQNVDESLQYSARRFPTVGILLHRMFTRSNDNVRDKRVESYLLKSIPLDRPTEVGWCMGASFILSRELYRQLQGFDERFFLYVEDLDLCYRCWEAGYSVVYLPQAVMIHAHQRGSRHFNKKTLMHLKSFFYFFTKHHFSIKPYGI